ncbi:MAG: amidohydrolase family protein [Anaerolineaceae bacterium]|nr:amidohydrolase family protein [Anaerolineaceae bacterium]
MRKMINIHGHMGKTSSGEAADLSHLVKEMDHCGIELTAISSLSGIDNKVQNDLVYNSKKQFPERVRALAFINPKAADVHKELDFRLGEQNFDGVKFHPWKHGYYSDNTPQIDEVLMHIEEYGVHCQVHVGTSPLATPFVWIRYAEKHPKIRLVLTHMGCREFGYSVLKTVKGIPNIWLETSVIYERDVIENVREEVGAEHIVFGTDWPYKSTEVEIAKVLKMGLNDEELKKVYYQNAKTLLARK